MLSAQLLGVIALQSVLLKSPDGAVEKANDWRVLCEETGKKLAWQDYSNICLFTTSWLPVS